MIHSNLVCLVAFKIEQNIRKGGNFRTHISLSSLQTRPAGLGLICLLFVLNSQYLMMQPLHLCQALSPSSRIQIFVGHTRHILMLRIHVRIEIELP